MEELNPISVNKSSGYYSLLLNRGINQLSIDDPELLSILEGEVERQSSQLVLVASSSMTDPSVLVCCGSTAVNVTAEGYPGRRYHAGCCVIDKIEQLAIDRAKEVFKAKYANVQSHSASTANFTILTSLLKPGDTLLGMSIHAGGHLTHGAGVSFSGQFFDAYGYGLTPDGFVDYDEVEAVAKKIKPKLIICGATMYPRILDFKRFREIAEKVNAILLADISHISGLVIHELHPNPIDHAHVTTTCTHKQLFGPRGGLIMSGKDYKMKIPPKNISLKQNFQSAVFPFSQGAPIMNSIAAKARALANAKTEEFRQVAQRITGNAKILASAFLDMGFKLISGGTDTHIVMLDLSPLGLTGYIVEKALEQCWIIVNKNLTPGDKRPATVTSGIRIGTNTLAQRNFLDKDVRTCAQLIHDVVRNIKAVGDKEFAINPDTIRTTREKVQELCHQYPVAKYSFQHIAN